MHAIFLSFETTHPYLVHLISLILLRCVINKPYHQDNWPIGTSGIFIKLIFWIWQKALFAKPLTCIFIKLISKVYDKYALFALASGCRQETAQHICNLSYTGKHLRSQILFPETKKNIQKFFFWPTKKTLSVWLTLILLTFQTCIIRFQKLINLLKKKATVMTFSNECWAEVSRNGKLFFWLFLIN